LKPPKRHRNINGYKKKYERKGRRPVIDFFERSRLIDYLYVGGNGSSKRGGFKIGTQTPRRKNGDPKTKISFIEAARKACINLHTAKKINQQYIEGGYKFLTTNEIIASKKPRKKKLKGI
jgi:hypothetical protein